MKYNYFYVFIFLVLSTLQLQGQNFFEQEWESKKITEPQEVNMYNTDITPPDTVGISVDTSEVINKILPNHFSNNANGYADFDWKEPGSRKLHNWQNANINFMRLPGGNWTSEYFWSGEVPYGVKEEYVDPKTDDWILKNKDFMELADSLDAEPVICVNYSLARYAADSIENPVQKAAGYAADWVRKVNKEMDMGVTYWEVGNEDYGPWQAGYCIDGDTITGDEYGRDFRIFVDSMKAVDPTIKVGAQVVNKDDGIKTYSGFNWWNKKVLPEVQDKADFLICHDYFTWAEDPNDVTVDEILSSVPKIGEDKQLIQNNVEKYTDKPADHFPVAMTEYNFRGGSKEISHVSGLFIAQALGEFIEYDYGMSMIWNMNNGYDDEHGGDHGIIAIGEPGVEDYTPHASFFAYHYYEQYFGDKLVKSSPKKENIRTYASTFSSGETGMVMVNLSGEAKSVELQFAGNTRYNNMVWHTVSSENPTNRWFAINGNKPSNDKNGPANYEEILPFYKEITSENPVMHLKPYSINYCLLSDSESVSLFDKEETICSNASVSVYPNPAHTRVHIRFERGFENNWKIELLTVSGKLMKKMEYTGSGKEKQINVEDMSPGLYILKISSGEKTITRKLQIN